jgi:hypothetical protein
MAGHVPTCAAPPFRSVWVGRRRPQTSTAAAIRASAVPPKATYGLNTALSTPPSDAPATAIVPHAEPAIAFAGARSSGGTRFGSAAEAAGVKNDFATA